jgi:hypothetical protein
MWVSPPRTGGDLDRDIEDPAGQFLTTNHGLRVNDDQNKWIVADQAVGIQMLKHNVGNAI